MIKNNKFKMLVTSLVIVAPMLFGLALHRQLPEQLPMHWGFGGTADGWGGSALVIWLLPLILLALHWLCVWITGLDRRQQGQNPKVLGIIFWIMPIISLLTNGIVYLVALDVPVPIFVLVGLLLGLLFLVMGNYMPKCVQNHTFGVKTRLTLSNEQNWDATHRFAGKAWVIGGVLMMALCFLPQQVMLWVLVPLVVVTGCLPAGYSYWFYRKQLREGSATKEDYRRPKSKKEKIGFAVAVCAVVLILAGVSVLMFTGGIQIKLDADAFTVQATYGDDLTVPYRTVQSVEYRPDGVDGIRVLGFASAKLQLGTFESESLGRYTRYTYTACDACILLRTDAGILVLSAADEVQTEALYLELLVCIGR